MNIEEFDPFLFDLPENLSNFEDFLKDLGVGNCVVLGGGGLSTPLGIPDWEELTYNLSKFSKLNYSKKCIEVNPDKWPDIAEEAKSYWEEKGQPDKYYNFLQNNLSPMHTSYNNTHL